MAVCFFTCIVSTVAQPSESVLIVENTIQYKKWVARIRPMVYVAETKDYTIELMAGAKPWKPLTIFAFWRNVGTPSQRLGFRADYYQPFLKKMSTNIQVRYLWRLAETTTNQYFFIPEVDYELARFLKVGLLGFYVKSERKDPIAYLGPSLNFIYSKKIKIGTYLSYAPDLLSKRYLLLAKIYYKLVLFADNKLPRGKPTRHEVRSLVSKNKK